MKITRLLMVAVLAVVASVNAFAQEENTREYTEEHPLVYEDVWDLWPYSFLNDQGEADGFNIDLIRMILGELKIPYTIRLRPMQEAYEALRDGKSDLMMGMAVGFHDEYGKFSRNAVTLFTQSAVSPKDQMIEVSSFRDLGKHKVYVKDGSMCHRLMIDYGWENNAIPVSDMREAIQMLSERGEGIMVWNTLSLKWLLRRYQLDNLVLTPVDMPHGEYKFMSNDPVLLANVDTIFTRLSSSEKLNGIQNKWFYPEVQEKTFPLWTKALLITATLIALLFVFYVVNFSIQTRRASREYSMRNKRLALILETSKVRLWTYDVAKNEFTRLNENGLPAYTYSSEEFAQRYHSGDFVRLRAALNQLARSVDGEREAEDVYLDVRAMDAEEGDTEERDFNVALSVLHRDTHGRVATILGTKRDVTEERRLQRLEQGREMRYWAIFNTPMVGITYYNREGILVNINEQACRILCCDREAILAEHVTFQDLFDLEGFSMADADGFRATHIVDMDTIPDSERKVKSIKRRGKLYQEVSLMAVRKDGGELMGLFAIGRDVTERVLNGRELLATDQQIVDLKEQLADYVYNINFVLQKDGLRMARYSPLSHMLTIYRGIDEVQNQVTQARCMTLVDEGSKKKTMRILNSMDNYSENIINTDIRTNIRVAGGEMLHLFCYFMPIHDNNGHITEYFGVCIDITSLKATESKLRQETAKAQEVANAQNSFLKNMSYEIRTPLNAVVGFAELFEMEHATEDEGIFVQEILNNSDRLLHLINSILFLSRIDAGMVEIDKQPTDFPLIFESNCRDGWDKHTRSDVKYVIENPYEKLVVDIDATNLGHIIYEVAANAAQYTPSGTVRARYDYIGRKLRISIEDTGIGMSQEALNRIYERFMTGEQQGGGGLGLPISKELAERMGGTLEISSDEGLGTTVWITIPCHASEIKRKKII